MDVQNDFCPGGNLPVENGQMVVPILNKLASWGKNCKYYDLVIDSQDSHPEDHGSFVSSHTGFEAFSRITLNGVEQILWPKHCVEGSWGWQFHPELDMAVSDKIVKKGQDKRVDSYSAFFDNGRAAATSVKEQFPYLGQSTGLYEYLLAEAEKRKSKTIAVDVGGLAFRFCVSFTAKDARSLMLNGIQFKVRIIEDAIKSIVFAEGDYEREIADLTSMGIEFLNSDDLISGFQSF